MREALRGGVRAILNLAAESHVDRSIHDSGPFVRTNVLGTQVLLDCAREFQVSRFLQVSTDEVYGSLGASGYFTEETPLARQLLGDVQTLGRKFDAALATYRDGIRCGLRVAGGGGDVGAPAAPGETGSDVGAT